MKSPKLNENRGDDIVVIMVINMGIFSISKRVLIFISGGKNGTLPMNKVSANSVLVILSGKLI